MVNAQFIDSVFTRSNYNDYNTEFIISFLVILISIKTQSKKKQQQHNTSLFGSQNISSINTCSDGTLMCISHNFVTTFRFSLLLIEFHFYRNGNKW